MSNPFEPYDFSKIRLFVEADLGAESHVPLSQDQTHYLRNVLRLPVDETVLVFNGRDGEWGARITSLHKKGGELKVEMSTRAQDNVPDLQLLFAPVKRARLDFLVQKATELGVASIRPVITERTIVSRINLARLRANVIEAAEQCGRMTVPAIAEPIKLTALLNEWTTDRRLIFCDEARNADPMSVALKGIDHNDRSSILIGPEGGFSDQERAAIRGLKAVLPVALGPRIMRADTAALAAVTIWQSVVGDLCV